MLSFANSTKIVGYENWYYSISIEFDVEKNWMICRNSVAGVTNFFVGILIILVFSKLGIQYMWQGEISVCKVLVPI